jgi:hypothetical protein
MYLFGLNLTHFQRELTGTFYWIKHNYNNTYHLAAGFNEGLIIISDNVCYFSGMFEHFPANLTSSLFQFSTFISCLVNVCFIYVEN